MRVILRWALAFASAALVAACGGQVVKNQDLKDIDAANFDGTFVGYFLPRAELTVSAAYDPENDTITISHEDAPKIVPDIRYHYYAVYHHNEFSNDDVTIQIDSNGLLKQISTTTTDQSTAIVQKIGEVAQEFGNLQKAVETTKKALTAPPPGPAPIPCTKLNAKATADVTYWNVKQRQRYATVTKKGGDCTLTLTVKVRPTVPLDAAAYPSTALQTGLDAKPCPRSAVCFRTASGFKATISAHVRKTDALKKLKGQEDVSAPEVFTFTAPDRERTGVLYFNRRAFVTNTTTADFTNGMLTKIAAKDPSAIAGALDLPIEILKSMTIFVKLN